VIIGAVTTALEPTVGLSVRGAAERSVAIAATIDTGFNGSLSLNKSLVAALNLSFRAFRRGTLADGSSHKFSVYHAEVEWDGNFIWIEVDCLEGQPLIGTRLLRHHELRIDMFPGGGVWITPRP
jgi:clan AA aspartic protease